MIREHVLSCVGFCNIVVEWAAHMAMYVGLSPSVNHRDELI